MIEQSLTLNNGMTLANRIVKSAMSEGLADANNNPTVALISLYQRWGQGGAGVLILGNTPVDLWHLEHAGNFVLSPHSDMDKVKQLAAAAKAGGAKVLPQLSHSGRQTPAAINETPLSISAVRLQLPGYGQPLSANDSQLKGIIKQFVSSALLAQEAGFDGVQIHSAHGYLLSSSLSGLINTRSDSWGGALADRAKLLLSIIREVRNAVMDDFIIAVKLNSSDFQKGGFSHAESITVAKMLEQEGIQFLEISGGNFETPVAYQQGSSATSTQIREAYFLDYAKDIKAALNIPVMVTGGFRSRHTMDNAITNGDADLIGIGRPFIIQPDFANQLLTGEIDQAPAVEWEFPDASTLPRGAALNWFCQQLCIQGQQGAADLNLPIELGHEQYLARIDRKTTELLAARK